jgi:hypothetical protein
MDNTTLVWAGGTLGGVLGLLGGAILHSKDAAF